MSAWRSGGIGPERTGAGLRGIAFIAIGIAFLGVSNQYVSSDDEPEPTTAGATVATVPAMRPVLAAALPGVTLRAGTSAELRRQAGAPGIRAPDLFVTDVAADAAALQGAGRCGPAVVVATGPAPATTRYVACAPPANEAGELLLATLTGLKTRSALLDAGFEVPEQR